MSRWLLVACVLSAWLAPARAEPPVDFTRDIRPLLVDRCYQCHGPDEKTRKGGLRLDDRDAALKKLRSGLAAIVPGDPAKSELIARLHSKEPTELMPPPKTGKSLNPREIALLERWVKEGAPYARHWAYVTPTAQPLPTPRQRAWIRNPLDAFVLARLEKEGLAPAAEADRLILLRRLTFDLTGLPPTREETQRFLADKRPDAYERLVDRLLASPAFGERWAVSWLDLARYADSQGYANDPDRTIWPYRDWVVRALNANLPYDQFTIEQLAGDLLPNATPDQVIATGFHRNTLTNTEGGTSAEEFRTAAVSDRVITTFQVWTATTMGCAQCHTHKYDPFSQKEFYQIFAIFNGCEDANSGDDRPTVNVILPGREAEHAQRTARLAEARKAHQAETARLDAALAAWEKTVDRKTLPKPIADILALDPAKRNGGQKNQLLTHHRGTSPTWKKLDDEIRSLDAQLKQLASTTPVLREMPRPRDTFVLIRGEFDNKGDRVNPGLPASLPVNVTAPKIDRLALARWLVDGNHPLTARVAVNRLWEELFGIGIVETSEDFGTQGELPSHPELIDWLALEYQRSGWDTKRLLRQIVTSATYRQTSQASDELVRRDPNNRLLARGPRVRLSAEMVRDQALFVAGLLSRKLGGPPVQPPRPNFALAAAFGSSTDWSTSPGEDRHRRGLYTRVRRNAPYPSFTTFDAPERTFCNIRRLRTNTPLQALVTLNDPVFFEAAQGLARRVVAEGGATPRDRARFAFETCLTRSPSPRELDRIETLYSQAQKRFATQRDHATSLATNPLGPLPAGADPVELAAWTIVSNTLLNLDETICRR
ncbi:MAG: PSD1 and planctomycete cytochrome C domain-containing protein [Gemmataceae bacterium]